MLDFRRGEITSPVGVGKPNPYENKPFCLECAIYQTHVILGFLSMNRINATHKIILFILLSVLITYTVIDMSFAQGRGKIYWTESDLDFRYNSGKIRRANLNGTAVEDLITEIHRPENIKLDPDNRKMYWTDSATGVIQCADFDGTNVENIINRFELRGLAIDVKSNTVYFGNWILEEIHQANLDGSDIKNINVNKMWVSTANIELDIQNGKIYWTDYWDKVIARANLDGTGTENLITDVRGVQGLALDRQNRKMYWTIAVSGTIHRANLNGTNKDELVTGLNYPLGLTLDLRRNRMYWVDHVWEGKKYIGKIQRSHLDGTNVKDILTGLDRPYDIAIDTDGFYDVAPNDSKLTTKWANIKFQ